MKAGDEILVDFVVPGDANARRQAAGIWKD